MVRNEVNMATFSASEARKQLYKLVDRVKETHEPIYITGKRNSAYLISEEDWHAVQETLYLDSIPGMRESIIKGMNTPLEETSEAPGW
jgi:antitoxin YefM